MPLALYIATPVGEAFDAEVEGVVLPGVEGDFGVLEGHEAFISALRAGSLEIQQSDGSRRVAAVPGGFAEISESTVSVMVGRCEFADEAGRDPEEIARERAEAMIEEMRATEEGEAFYQQYQDAFSEAVAPEDSQN